MIDPSLMIPSPGVGEPRPISLSPCPQGYALQNIGGDLVCVLESHDQISQTDLLLQAAPSKEIPPGANSRPGFIYDLGILP